MKRQGCKSIFMLPGGFSLINSLIAVAIVGINLAVLVSLLSSQQKESKHVQQSLLSSSIKYNILQTLKDPNNCLCQFRAQNEEDKCK